MNQLQFQSLRALRFLGESKLTLDELADKLNMCRRHTQRVIRQLKINGYSVKGRIMQRKKYFWIEQNSDILPAILSPDEKNALSYALTSHNTNLQSAVYKLTQLINLQLYFHSAK